MPPRPSSLTYIVGATANGLGGIVGDWMVRRYGLRNGRRWIGVAGLSAAALSLTAAIFAPSGNLALVFLSCAYGGILFQQPTLCALCLDVGRKNAGAVFGFMNTAANASSAVRQWSLATWLAMPVTTTRRSSQWWHCSLWGHCYGGRRTRRVNCFQKRFSMTLCRPLP